MNLVEHTSVPILNVDYALSRVEHAYAELDAIYNTGGIIQPCDMQNLTSSLNELKVQLEVYRTSINQFEKRRKGDDKRMSNSLRDRGNACINGDLVVHLVPIPAGKKSVGKFLIYRIADDENWFWSFTPSKLKAMEVAYRIKGHAVEIKSIEF